MKLSFGTLLLSASSGGAAAFAPSTRHSNNGRAAAAGWLSMSDGVVDGVSKKKVLTAADVMAKSKTSASAGGGGGADDPAGPGAQDAPKIFSEATYDDFQSSLLLLEKRAKDGAGSLTSDEVSQFEEETGRIVKEMKEYLADPKGCEESIQKGYASKEAAIDVTAEKIKEGKHIYMEPVTEEEIKPKLDPTVAAYDSPPKIESPPPAAAAPAAATTPPLAVEEKREPLLGPEDMPSDETITHGLARGTTNTYAIPGMEEMSPEEYRAKLQETVSAHQTMRRKQSLANNKGLIGNASSQGYLEGLSGTGGGGAPGGGKEKQG